MITNTEVVLMVLMVCTLTLVYSLMKSDKKVNYLKGLFRQPLQHYSSIDNSEALNSIQESIQKLTDSEVEIVLQTIWGRPVRIIKGRDKDGSTWFETVTYWVSQDDENFHFQDI
ncbi:MAG: hypothetical protein KJ771_08275, partial [Nanoarchaeota archaeon]|nr:hypothetical protein [Nanoarchaeota archaeon]